MVEGTLSRPAYVDTLLKALQTEVPGAEVRAEQVRGDRYRFFVVSGRFDALGHPERQEQVWDIADRVLDKPTLRKVTMILTLGLDDVPQDDDADGEARSVGT